MATPNENEEQRTNVKGPKGWLVSSPQSKQVIVTGGHNVPDYAPDLVVTEIVNVHQVARER
jgi:hypothetical protein